MWLLKDVVRCPCSLTTLFLVVRPFGCGLIFWSPTYCPWTVSFGRGCRGVIEPRRLSTRPLSWTSQAVRLSTAGRRSAIMVRNVSNALESTKPSICRRFGSRLRATRAFITADGKRVEIPRWQSDGIPCSKYLTPKSSTLNNCSFSRIHLERWIRERRSCEGIG